MNNFNYQLNELEEKILQLLQEFNVPVGIYYLLLSKITQDLKQLYDQQISLEKYEIQNQQFSVNQTDSNDTTNELISENSIIEAE